MKLSEMLARGRFLCVPMLIITLTLAAGPAQATPIDGSIVLNASGASQDGANLAVSTLFTPEAITDWAAGPVFTANRLTMDDGSGDFAGLPYTLITADTLDTADLEAWTFTSSEGSWVTITGSIVTSNADFLEVLLTGTFTPVGTLSSSDPAAGEVLISLNQAGTSVGWTSTMNMTGPPIPEPMTMSILGMGGLAIFRRRRRN